MAFVQLPTHHVPYFIVIVIIIHYELWLDYDQYLIIHWVISYCHISFLMFFLFSFKYFILYYVDYYHIIVKDVVWYETCI